MRSFLTFKPKDPLLQGCIDYYYLDIADAPDYINEYTCYPHVNNTISLYRSHVWDRSDNRSVLSYREGAACLQIFTPLREQELHIRQFGPVHKLAIVFKPLGAYNFWPCILFTRYTADYAFFSEAELELLFNSRNPDVTARMLDACLLERYNPGGHRYLEKALELLHRDEGISVDYLAERYLGISRKHLNRLFRRYLGTSVQTYRNILRFRKLVSGRLSEDPGCGPADYQAYYTDQAHFIRNCKKLTGLTPKQFFHQGKQIGTEDTFWTFASRREVTNIQSR